MPAAIVARCRVTSASGISTLARLATALRTGGRRLTSRPMVRDSRTTPATRRRRNDSKAANAAAKFNFVFSDTGEKYMLELENGVLNHTAGVQADHADTSVTLTRATLAHVEVALGDIGAFGAVRSPPPREELLMCDLQTNVDTSSHGRLGAGRRVGPRRHRGATLLEHAIRRIRILDGEHDMDPVRRNAGGLRQRHGPESCILDKGDPETRDLEFRELKSAILAIAPARHLEAEHLLVPVHGPIDVGHRGRDDRKNEPVKAIHDAAMAGNQRPGVFGEIGRAHV